MQSIPDIILTLQARLAADEQLARFIDGRFIIQLDGPSESKWVLDARLGWRLDGSDQSECQLHLSSSDFLSLMSGSLNPQVAFLKGQIRLAGDMALALKFIRLCPKYLELGTARTDS